MGMIIYGTHVVVLGGLSAGSTTLFDLRNNLIPYSQLNPKQSSYCAVANLLGCFRCNNLLFGKP
jgi:hypothetical protein